MRNTVRLSLAALILAACTTEQPVEPVRQGTEAQAGNGFGLPTVRSGESPAKTLDDYARYEGVMRAAKAGDDIQPAQFLAGQSASAMGENVRNE